MAEDLITRDSPQNSESVWKRLTRLFRSGPVVRHKIAAGERLNEPQGTARAYKKELSNLYVHSLASYGQYERLSRYSDYSEMEMCIAPNTLIAVPGGFKTIKELADEFGLDREFVVYSYDHQTRKIVAARAKQARMTRKDAAYKVTFDNGKFIVGTIDHRLMLRSGQYRKIGELKSGDAMMPFKREFLWNGEYQSIYTGTKWEHEHRILGEFIVNRKLEHNEIVHHVNEKKFDNRLENLEVMTNSEHASHHLRERNKIKWNPQNEKWITKFRQDHSKFMTEKNPSARLDVTFSSILQVAEQNDFHMSKTMDFFDIDSMTVGRRLQEFGFKNWGEFSRAYNPGWRNHGQDNEGVKNPRWDNSLTFQKICDAWEPGIETAALIKKLGSSRIKLSKRVKSHGFTSIADFCKNYKNCRVVSVEYVGEMELYDLTVDGYKNFATDSVVSHNTPEINSALDIFADETTAYGDDGTVLKIVSKDEEIKQILETFFFDIINIEFNIWSWVRNLVKYGDFVLFVDASETNGILNLLPIPINEIEREEGYDPKDPFAVRFRWLTQGNMILENWQVIHFRLLGNDSFLPYGSSMIEAARRIWRQLILIEDAMMVYRIVRSPERRVFKIDVGNINPNDVDSFMEQVKTKLRRNQIVDPNSGRVDLRYNPLSVDEDYFIPVRGDKGSDISTLAGGQFTGDIDDVQYIQNKLFAALKVPKAHLGYEAELGSKATLAQQDVRFARTIERIQKIVISELNKIAIIHLFLLGYSGKDLVNFSVEMANPSTIAEQQKLELWRMRFEIAGSAQEGMLDRGSIYQKIFNLSDKDIENVKEGKRLDKLEDMQLESMVLPEGDSEAAAPDEGGEGGGGGLPGAEELPNTLGGEPGGGGEENIKPESVVRTEKRNPGSEGSVSGIAVDKGKNLFSTGEDASKLVFGTEKQTASDPADTKYIRRMITRPFSEEKKPADSLINEQIDLIEKIDHEIDDVIHEFYSGRIIS